MPLSIGDYTITYGDARDNYFNSDSHPKAFFGKEGDDKFNLYWSVESGANGQYDTPQIASGGAGNDYYSVHLGASAIIIDNGNSSSEIDKLRWRGSAWTTYAYSVDERHISLVDTRYNSSALIIDGLNDKGRIEELLIDGSWIDVSSNQVTDYLQSYNYRLEKLIGEGVLYPPAIGLSDANSVRNKIQEVYDDDDASISYIKVRQFTTRTWTA